MSRELREIEKIAAEGKITDHERIGTTMEAFLDLSCEELTGNENRYRFIASDIANGFHLVEEKVKKLKLRDILTIIGYMPGISAYRIPGSEEWFYTYDYEDVHLPRKKGDNRFFSAPNCFILAQIIKRRQTHISALNQFMHIDYMAYMLPYLTKWSGTKRKSSPVLRFYLDSKTFIEDYRERKGIAKNSERGLTISDVITTACDIGERGWICGIMPLSSYVNDVYSAYWLMKTMFIDCIGMPMVKPDRTAFRALLDRCSSDGIYPEKFYSQINFDNCHEYRKPERTGGRKPCQT